MSDFRDVLFEYIVDKVKNHGLENIHEVEIDGCEVKHSAFLRKIVECFYGIDTDEICFYRKPVSWSKCEHLDCGMCWNKDVRKMVLGD